MYLIVQKIHVILSGLELKLFIVMGKLFTVAFVAMATRNLAISVVTRVLFLLFVNVHCG